MVLTLFSFSRPFKILLVAATILVPSTGKAFDAGPKNISRLGFFTERLTNRGEDPKALDGLIYLYCAPGLAGPTKIGVSNEANYKSRNSHWMRKETTSSKFDLNTRQIVRGLTRAEAWTVERNTHAYLKARDHWLDPKQHAHNSTEVFDVSCAEALTAVKIQAGIIRRMRSDDEKTRARQYAVANPSAARPDDATDFRRSQCRKKVDLPGNSRFIRKIERTVGMGSTLHCKLTN